MKKIVLSLALLGLTGSLLAADASLGTWKMNMSKSKFSPGPAPKSVTATYSEDGGWIVVKTEGMDSDGKAISRTGRYKRDGNDYPYEGPNGKGMINLKQTDDRHIMAVTKLEAGGTITSRTVISKDGKTRTQTSTGTNSKGEKVDTVTVFERQ